MESARRWVAVWSVALVAASFGPASASAQSDLDASQAEEFLGTWDLPLQTDMGQFNVELVIADEGGKVSVTVGSVDMGTMSVTEVMREGDALILDYDIDAQGQFIPVHMELTRDGAELAYEIDAAGGQFMVSGKGTRAAG